MSKGCNECIHNNPDFVDKVCLHCTWSPLSAHPSFFEPKPTTNADRIRAMTDEELAEYLAPCACPPIKFNKNTGDIVCPVNKEPSASDCKSCWLDWLKEEVESNDS